MANRFKESFSFLIPSFILDATTPKKRKIEEDFIEIDACESNNEDTESVDSHPVAELCPWSPSDTEHRQMSSQRVTDDFNDDASSCATGVSISTSGVSSLLPAHRDKDSGHIEGRDMCQRHTWNSEKAYLLSSGHSDPNRRLLREKRAPDPLSLTDHSKEINPAKRPRLHSNELSLVDSTLSSSHTLRDRVRPSSSSGCTSFSSTARQIALQMDRLRTPITPISRMALNYRNSNPLHFSKREPRSKDLFSYHSKSSPQAPPKTNPSATLTRACVTHSPLPLIRAIDQTRASSSKRSSRTESYCSSHSSRSTVIQTTNTPSENRPVANLSPPADFSFSRPFARSDVERASLLPFESNDMRPETKDDNVQSPTPNKTPVGGASSSSSHIPSVVVTKVSTRDASVSTHSTDQVASDMSALRHQDTLILPPDHSFESQLKSVGEGHHIYDWLETVKSVDNPISSRCSSDYTCPSSSSACQSKRALFLSSPSRAARIWRCDTCLIENRMHLALCPSCSTPRETESRTLRSSHMESGDATAAPLESLIASPLSDTLSIAASMPVQVSDIPPTYPVMSFINTWSCSQCSTRNCEQSSACSQCTRPKQVIVDSIDLTKQPTSSLSEINASSLTVPPTPAPASISPLSYTVQPFQPPTVVNSSPFTFSVPTQPPIPVNSTSLIGLPVVPADKPAVSFPFPTHFSNSPASSTPSFQLSSVSTAPVFPSIANTPTTTTPSFPSLGTMNHSSSSPSLFGVGGSQTSFAPQPLPDVPKASGGFNFSTTSSSGKRAFDTSSVGEPSAKSQPFSVTSFPSSNNKKTFSVPSAPKSDGPPSKASSSFQFGACSQTPSFQFGGMSSAAPNKDFVFGQSTQPPIVGGTNTAASPFPFSASSFTPNSNQAPSTFGSSAGTTAAVQPSSNVFNPVAHPSNPTSTRVVKKAFRRHKQT